MTHQLSTTHRCFIAILKTLFVDKAESISFAACLCQQSRFPDEVGEGNAAIQVEHIRNERVPSVKLVELKVDVVLKGGI